MRRRPVERHLPDGPMKPSSVMLRRRRRQRCFMVSVLVLFVMLCFASSAAVLTYVFQEKRLSNASAQPLARHNEGMLRHTTSSRLPPHSRSMSSPEPGEGILRDASDRSQSHDHLRRDQGQGQRATQSMEREDPTQTRANVADPEATHSFASHTSPAPATSHPTATVRHVESSKTATSSSGMEITPTPVVATSSAIATSRSLEIGSQQQQPSDVTLKYVNATTESQPSANSPKRNPPFGLRRTAFLRLFPQLRLLACGAAGRGTNGDESEDECLQPDLPVRDQDVTARRQDTVLSTKAAEALRLPFSPSDTVAPLHKMKVELYRQRVDRSTWWTPSRWLAQAKREREETATAARTLTAEQGTPIVALRGTYLPVTHFFPRELLVEEVLSGDDGVTRYPDPLHRVPMQTAVRPMRPTAPGASGDDVDKTEEVRVYSTEAVGVSRPAPVLRVRSTRLGDGNASLPSSGSPMTASASADVELQWQPAETALSARDAVGVQLFTVRPQMGKATDEDGEWDSSRSTSLAAIFTFPRLRRLYGLPGAGAAQWDTAATPTETDTAPHASTGAPNRVPPAAGLSARFGIPADGFSHVASVRGRDMNDYTPAPGVMPLIFADIEVDEGKDDLEKTGDGERASPSDAEQRGGHRSSRPLGERTVGILWMSSAPFSVRTQRVPAAQQQQQQEQQEQQQPAGTTRTRLTLTSSAAETRVFLLPGPTHADVLRQYYTLTGFPSMPPLFALGYQHHFSTDFQDDVRAAALAGNGGAEQQTRGASAADAGLLSLQKALEEVNGFFLSHHLPVDSIGFTGGTINHRLTPFSWQPRLVPDPVQMQAELWMRGRRYFFTRASPHIPVLASSPLYQEGKAKGFFVSVDPDDDTWFTTYPREAAAALLAEEMGQGLEAGREGNKAGAERHAGGGSPRHARVVTAAQGNSWVRSRSHVVDMFNPHARRWFGSMLKQTRFTGSTGHTFVALSAAAPDAIFVDGLTLPMTTGHHGGTIHRQVHNAYSSYYLLAAFNGLMRRGAYGKRAVAPIEGYFAGAQRFGAAVVVVPSQTDAERKHDGSDGTPSGGTEAGPLRAAWNRLRRALDDVVALSMSGLPFVGTNTAGFEVDLHLARKTSIIQPAETAHAADGNVPARHARAATEAEQLELMVRWYEATSLLPFMRTEEGRGVPFHLPATAPSPSSLWKPSSQLDNRTRCMSEALSSAVLPGLLHTEGARAVSAALRLRYALLPHLYTSLWRTSETGAPTVFSPSFLHADGATGSGTETEDHVDPCFAVGESVTLVACPITRPVTRQPAADAGGAPQELKEEEGIFPVEAMEERAVVRLPTLPAGSSHASFYDLYTGSRYDAGQAVAVPMAVDAATASAGLDEPPVPPPTDAGQRSQTKRGAVSRLPLFQRDGTILVTFTGPSLPEEVHGSPSPLWGTHSPRNISLVVALPPGLAALRDNAPSQDTILATGEMFWDDGSANHQVPPPPSSLPEEPGEEDEDGEALENEAQAGQGRRALDAMAPDEAADAEDEAAAMLAQRRQRRRQAEREDRIRSLRQRRAQQRMRGQAQYCHVGMSVRLHDGRLWLRSELMTHHNESAGSEGPDAEQRCLLALKGFEATWNAVPRQTRLDYEARQREAAQQRRERQRKLNDEAERGERRLTDRELEKALKGDDASTDGPLGEDDVFPAGTRITHTLATSMQRQSIRYLTANQEDAAWLRALLDRHPLTVSTPATVPGAPHAHEANARAIPMHVQREAFMFGVLGSATAEDRKHAGLGVDGASAGDRPGEKERTG